MTDPRLDELVTRWNEARRQRPEVTPEEICSDCPELVPSLKEQLHKLLQDQTQGAIDPYSTVPPAPPDAFTATDPFATQEPTAPSVDPVFVPGAPTIAGYDILAELGRGGMGVVFLAKQRATKRKVALKVMLHGNYATDMQRRRFEREVDLAASLRHPHIVTVYDSGTTSDGLPYCVMEYIEGRCLDEHLRVAPLEQTERLRLCAAICQAVNAAHQHGVIHRDLKPGNIRIDTDGAPHILDFGLAKTVGTGDGPDGRNLTHTGEFLGTLAYAAPEQASGDPNRIDTRTDVYALGIMLYEMLTGVHPHPIRGNLSELIKALTEREVERPSLRHPHAGIDESLDAIVTKALARNREQRYQSAGALADDILHYLAGEPIQAKSPSMAQLMRRWLRQNLRKTVWVVVIGVMCGGLGALGVGLSVLPLLNLCASVYERFPHLNRPWLATRFAIHPDWIHAINLLGTTAFISMGWFTAVLVRPQNRSEQVLTGLVTGIIGGVTAFCISLGWVSVIALTLKSSGERDLGLLRQYSMDRNAPALIEVYPDLEPLSPEERGNVLVEKVLSDMVIGMARGVWLGILFVVTVFCAASVSGTRIAGVLLTRHGQPRMAILPYLEAMLPSAWLIAEVYLTLFLPQRQAVGTTRPLVFFLVLTTLSVTGVLRRWPWALRGSAYVAALLAFYRSLMLPWSASDSAAAAVVTLTVLCWCFVWRKQPS